MAGSLLRSAARLGWLVALVAAGVAASCTSNSTMSCPTGQSSCAQGCTDTRTDPLHCGACGITCNAGSACVAGICTCPSPSDISCFGVCVDSRTDAANCGGCGNSCGQGWCGGGACTCNSSPPTVQFCPNDPHTPTCVDIATNPYNCNGCGLACGTGYACAPCAAGCAGQCVCNPPRQVCPSGAKTVCTDTSSDPSNCGICGNVCPAGQTCSAGTCQQTCATGLTLCSGACVDVKTDPANCGSCGHACGTGQNCSAGTCQSQCTTLTCNGACCQAPLGNTCCPSAGACPSQHKNFPGTSMEQAYYDCTLPATYNATTAQVAAQAWTPASAYGKLINLAQMCPGSTIASRCLAWQRDPPLSSAERACAVFCYDESLQGAVTVTLGNNCECPTVLSHLDWY
ncbi:MAG: hypothetical protein WCK73_04045 [Deltaproteobacteria bacterium]